jgi:hypothetical protein
MGWNRTTQTASTKHFEKCRGHRRNSNLILRRRLTERERLWKFVHQRDRADWHVERRFQLRRKREIAPANVGAVDHGPAVRTELRRKKDDAAAEAA